MQLKNNNELRTKIDEKLQSLPKRKTNYGNTTTTTSDKTKIMQKMKWQTIKRHLRQHHHLQRKDTGKGLQIVKPLEQKGELMDIIKRVMILQQSIINLSQNITNYRRVQMVCIFFQCSLSIIFNSYNLVVFLLKIASNPGSVKLSLSTLFLFYGYHIVTSLLDTITSIMVYHKLYEMIRTTGTIVDNLNIYISDDTIRSRLTQLSAFIYNNLRIFTLFGLFDLDGSLITSILSGTITYIIILIQYSGNGEICTVPTNLNGSHAKH